MKKIIHPGRKEAVRTIKRFKCRKCKCVFECDRDEYNEYDHYKLTHFYSNCPECGDTGFEVLMRE